MSKFLDVYSSPIVRRFFSHLLANKCDIILPDHLGCYITVAKLETKYEVREDWTQYSTLIEGNVITFTFLREDDGSIQLDFTVNHSFTRRDNLSKRAKLATVRWLLEVWAIEKHKSHRFICSPCRSEDDFRANYYSQFGFKWIDSHYMELVVA
jgi:hypothetical protein